MTTRQIIVIASAITFCSLTAYAVRVEFFDRTLLRCDLDGHTIVVYREVRFLDPDSLLYKVVAPDGTIVGPYHIGRASRDPRFDIHRLNRLSLCVFDTDHPDDVCCYVDLANASYYPSPDDNLTDVNAIIRTRYRATASMTSVLSW